MERRHRILGGRFLKSRLVTSFWTFQKACRSRSGNHFSETFPDLCVLPNCSPFLWKKWGGKRALFYCVQNVPDPRRANNPPKPEEECFFLVLCRQSGRIIVSHGESMPSEQNCQKCTGGIKFNGLGIEKNRSWEIHVARRMKAVGPFWAVFVPRALFLCVTALFSVVRQLDCALYAQRSLLIFLLLWEKKNQIPIASNDELVVGFNTIKEIELNA